MVNFYRNFIQTLTLFFAMSLLSCSDSDEPITSGDGITVETITPDGNYGGHDGLSIDSQGSIYVSHLAGGNGKTIFKVSPEGVTSILSTALSAPMGHAFDANDNLYVANDNSTTINIINPQGEISEYMTDQAFQGGSLALDTDGTLYHSVYSTNTVYKISPQKELTTLASGSPLNVPFGITLDPDKNVYVANFSNGVINKITPDGQVTTLATVPSFVGYLIYANGKLYATGFTSHNIYMIELDGTLNILAGTSTSGNTDGSGTQASFFSPNGIDASPDGKTLYISQSNFKIRKITLP